MFTLPVHVCTCVCVQPMVSGKGAPPSAPFPRLVSAQREWGGSTSKCPNFEFLFSFLKNIVHIFTCTRVYVSF